MNGAADRRRAPPKSVQFLLPVWGNAHVETFLKFGLPTMLAPGNIPALAERCPCVFVFLTQQKDKAKLEHAPAVKRLGQFCRVDFQSIDDLITGTNHSTTITLAYARAVLRAGSAMLETCFFFLVS